MRPPGPELPDLRQQSLQEGERGFHCNYYLVAGASPDLKRTLKITTGAEGFRYLSNENRRIPGVDDGVQFRAVSAVVHW